MNIFRSIREAINFQRQNYKARKRKQQLMREADPLKTSHLTPAVTINSEWYGSSYGGFYIIPEFLNSESIVYSIGIGKDISFDLACLKKHHCNIFAFDPTPVSIEYISSKKIQGNFVFHNFGLSEGESGFSTFYLPVNPRGVSGSLMPHKDIDTNRSIKVEMKSFADIVSTLKHKHIDVLKMDIEGSEYQVLPAILDASVTIDQILVEFHDRMFDSDEPRSLKTVEAMRNKGYEIFAASESFEEISFIHKRKLNRQLN